MYTCVVMQFAVMAIMTVFMPAVDPCNGVNCGHGTCQSSPEDTAHFECICQPNWTGKHCDQGTFALGRLN